MVRPSENWSGFTGLKPESEKYQRIQLLLSSANFDYLKKRALESRRKYQPHSPLEVDCIIEMTKFASGLNNLVLELEFSDNVYWIARIPYRVVDDRIKTSLLSEIATIKTVREHTSIPVSQIYEFEISADKPFGYPYVFMEYLGGRTLDDGLVVSIPSQYHSKVAKQFANVFAELQNLTFDRIGRLWCGENADQTVEIINMAWHSTPGPLETSLEYFFNQRQGENRETVSLHPNDPDWLTACWVLKSALSRIIIEDRIRGPFPLCHLDLHFGNLLFDEEYNLKGVIDWSDAQAAPLEQLAVCPEFATFPALSEEKNRPTIEFKKLVLLFLEERETESRKQGLDLTTLSAFMASKSAEITYRQYMASPRGSLWAGKTVAKLMYGNSITWEQLKEVYGSMPIS